MMTQYIIYFLIAAVVAAVCWKMYKQTLTELVKKSKELNDELEYLNFERSTMEHLKLLYSELDLYYATQQNPNISFLVFRHTMDGIHLPNHKSDNFIPSCVLQIETLESLFQSEIPRLKSQKIKEDRIANIKELLS
jgi:hypothetical protein